MEKIKRICKIKSRSPYPQSFLLRCTLRVQYTKQEGTVVILIGIVPVILSILPALAVDFIPHSFADCKFKRWVTNFPLSTILTLSHWDTFTVRHPCLPQHIMIWCIYDAKSFTSHNCSRLLAKNSVISFHCSS